MLAGDFVDSHLWDLLGAPTKLEVSWGLEVEQASQQGAAAASLASADGDGVSVSVVASSASGPTPTSVVGPTPGGPPVAMAPQPTPPPPPPPPIERPLPPSIQNENARVLALGTKVEDVTKWFAAWADERCRCKQNGSMPTTLLKYFKAYVVLRTKGWLKLGVDVPLPGEPKELIQFIDLDGPQTFDSVARLGPPLSAAVEEVGVDMEQLRSYQDEYLCRYILKQLMLVGTESVQLVAEKDSGTKENPVQIDLVAGAASPHELKFSELLSALVEWAGKVPTETRNSPILNTVLKHLGLLIVAQHLCHDYAAWPKGLVDALQYFMKPVPKVPKGETQSKCDQYRLWFHRFVIQDAATNALPFSKLVARFEKSLLDAETRASSLKQLDQQVASLGAPQPNPMTADGIVTLRRATQDAEKHGGSETSTVKTALRTLDLNRAAVLKRLHGLLFNSADLPKAKALAKEFLPALDPTTGRCMNEVIAAFELVREIRQYCSLGGGGDGSGPPEFVLCEKVVALMFDIKESFMLDISGKVTLTSVHRICCLSTADRLTAEVQVALDEVVFETAKCLEVAHSGHTLWTARVAKRAAKPEGLYPNIQDRHMHPRLVDKLFLPLPHVPYSH